MKAIICGNLSSNLYSRKNLLKAILAQGWKIVAMACPDHSVEKIETELGIPFYSAQMENKGTGVFSDIRTFFSFYFFYRQQRPDVVLQFNSKPDIYGSMAATLLGIPSISNITGLGGLFNTEGGFVQKIVCMLYKIAFSGSKVFVFFQNQDDRTFFIDRKIIDKSKTGLLPGSGVDIHYFVPKKSPNANLEKIDKKSANFLYAGRLVIAKGIREFISAAKIIKSTYPGCNFDVIGEMNTAKGFISEDELTEAIQTGAIQYHGNTQDIISFIAKADCVVLPSYYREGVPRTLLEAAAMAKPLIAADSIGTREPVRAYENGFLCKPGDAIDLAKKMQEFLCLSKTQINDMGNKSRIVAEKEYSDTIISNNYLERLPKGKAK